ncbi:hypothetical protein BsWGS_29125 [Bradybaena similaris]
MSSSELYTKGARVWIPDPNEVWRGAELLEDYHGQSVLRIQYENKAEEGTINVTDKSLPHLRNPEILIGENDLTSLSYLNEPEVLYNLKVRFAEQNMIYTYCGIVLVAINPYESLDIYNNDIIQAYSGQDIGAMDPHIFAVSEEAYKQMSRFDANQSIIVSGESGAGKTVSAKYAMRYFATVGGSQTETQVERKVLASNPIMEAIGNAKTTRNDNSSRFGKYIEISFSKQHVIVGANMRTYLLEKSRVVFQTSEERNYHIFYQLCASASLPEFQEFQLRACNDFFYASQGGAPMISDVNDAEEMSRTREAFTTLGFSESDQMMIFQILSAILHFGNVLIKERSGESSEISAADVSVTIMCKLLGIEESQMRMWLCNRKIQTINEILIKPLTRSQAILARDALVKTIYSRLFDWIVCQINRALHTSAKAHKFIGVLDIYGFETFQVNSFEQFCINYANEKLQQIFNMHVFKLEQEEYVREAIVWSFIDFYDNQPCIDLIESKLGILDLLDDECKMPRGSDENWCQKLYDKHLNKSQHFAKPRMSRKAFIIHHFAEKVEYQSDGFLEKNRDTVLEEQVNTLKASQFVLVAALFTEDIEDGSSAGAERRRSRSSSIIQPLKAQPKAGSKQHKKTVGSQFRDSLCSLMDTLNATSPHYIRCIKPNDLKEAFLFEPKRAVEQLRACGVLETIRISAAGYPSRWTYPEFFQRYRVLASSKHIIKTDLLKTCEAILPTLIPDEDKYRFGKTKIFFRAGQVAYLEKLRTTKLRACGVMIQKHIRGWLQRRKYQSILISVRLVQTFARGLLSRRYAKYLLSMRAATRIQTAWRAYYQWKRFKGMYSAVIIIQAHVRALFARKLYTDLLRHHKALVLQKYIRAYLQRQKFRCVMQGIILMQCHFRRRKAQVELKMLKVEARSVDHIKQVNQGLENKVIELQQRLDIQTKQAMQVKVVEAEMAKMKDEIERLKNVEATVRVSSNKFVDMEEELVKLKSELQKMQVEKQDWITEKEQMRLQHETVINNLHEDKLTLTQKLEEAYATVKQLEEKNEEFVKEKTAMANNLLIEELDSERSHHQKLVSEYTRLQQRFNNLQDEMEVLTGKKKGHRKTSSDASAISSDSDNSSVADTEQREDNEKKPNGNVDISLLLKLQNRVKHLEKEKKQLRKAMASMDETLPVRPFIPDSAFYTLRMQDLQNENDKLKREIGKLMKSISETANFGGSSKKGSSKAAIEFLAQFEAVSEELQRSKEECLQLRTMLADKTITTHHLAEESDSGIDRLVNEDNELEVAYKTQRDLNRLLQKQLDKTEQNLKNKETEWADDLKKLKEENENQQKIIMESINLGPDAKLDVMLKNEICRLISENVDLRESIDKQADELHKLKNALKMHSGKLKSGEAVEMAAEVEKKDTANTTDAIATVKLRERTYLGMFEIKKESVQTLIKCLILQLEPKLAVTLTPGLPAYILFMCVRHADHIHDDEKVKSLLTSALSGIKKVVKKYSDDPERITLWLANTCRLIHTLKQYSGEEQFQVQNTPQQNAQNLRNFDLSEYRQVFSDLAVWSYQALMKQMMELIQPLIVPAILEHEAIAGLTASKPSGLRGRSSSIVHDLEDKKTSRHPLDDLIERLNSLLDILTLHAVDLELIKQIIRQIFYFLCANTLNNLLLRKDMCNWSKGMQIRYNLTYFEQWLRDNFPHEPGVADVLEPVIQASQLLQARKTDSDVNSICDLCSKMTMAQIIKILNMYTPVDDFEERVHPAFIRKIQAKLKLQGKSPSSTLLMDTKFSYPVTFPFNASSVALETITLPEELHLNFLIRH